MQAVGRATAVKLQAAVLGAHGRCQLRLRKLRNICPKRSIRAVTAAELPRHILA